MDVNVGGLDRKFRIILSPFLIIAGIVGTLSPQVGFTILGLLSLIFGGVFAVTAYMQKCPVNQALGVNTAAKSSGTASE